MTRTPNLEASTSQSRSTAAKNAPRALLQPAMEPNGNENDGKTLPAPVSVPSAATEVPGVAGAAPVDGGEVAGSREDYAADAGGTGEASAENAAGSGDGNASTVAGATVGGGAEAGGNGERGGDGDVAMGEPGVAADVEKVAVPGDVRIWEAEISGIGAGSGGAEEAGPGAEVATDVAEVLSTKTGNDAIGGGLGDSVVLAGGEVKNEAVMGEDGSALAAPNAGDAKQDGVSGASQELLNDAAGASAIGVVKIGEGEIGVVGDEATPPVEALADKELISVGLDYSRVDIYALGNYTFGRKDTESRGRDMLGLPAAEITAHREKRFLEIGMRRSIAAVLLVHVKNFPHVLLLQRSSGEGQLALPGGKLRPGESEENGLRRKLSRKLSPENSAMEAEWDIGDERRLDSTYQKCSSLLFFLAGSGLFLF